jgi:hypothetical protein
LIKYIKSVLWRVAKRLSHIEDARCIKLKSVFVRKYKFWFAPFFYLRLLFQENNYGVTDDAGVCVYTYYTHTHTHTHTHTVGLRNSSVTTAVWAALNNGSPVKWKVPGVAVFKTTSQHFDGKTGETQDKVLTVCFADRTHHQPLWMTSPLAVSGWYD